MLMQKIDSEPIDLFDGHFIDLEPEFFDCAYQIRTELTDTIKKCSLSRQQIADKMSDLMRKDFTKESLDSFTAESKRMNRFPLEYLPAFCAATNDKTIIRFIAKKCLGLFIENDDSLRLELGRISEEEKTLKQRKRLIASLLEKNSAKR